ncbi:hypothetical protein BUALT_Bualt19G0107800 [Buddleja alternifolia]|uniref:C2 domain-containing protein n=1 Tax=Buddleja alternifolia TaxID=168488 RepID=A0AAV6W6S7_9LAMI|nr:hypothetical protein BUALT_Bualt19G0107800 [Buddleja alternifolia]
MSICGIQGQSLELTDGGKNPKFQEKFVFNLIEGLREISVVVWNKNTVSYDDFIGNGKVQLQKVLSQGYDDSAWALQDKKGRYAGEIRLIMHYPNFNKSVTSYGQSAPPYGGAQAPQIPPYLAPPSLASYPPTSYPAPPHYPSHHPNPAVYPTPPAAYPPVYPPPSSYPPHSAYPQDPYQYYPAGVYPPPTYPPPPY